jgi:hypothetical protein
MGWITDYFSGRSFEKSYKLAAKVILKQLSVEYRHWPDAAELSSAVWIALLLSEDMSQASPAGVREYYNRNQQFVRDEAERQFSSDPLLREVVQQTLFVMWGFQMISGGNREKILGNRFFSAKVPPLDARGYKRLVEAYAKKVYALWRAAEDLDRKIAEEAARWARGLRPQDVDPAAGGDHPKGRILIVDDDPEWIESLFRMLGRAGYDCLGFTRAANALEALPSQPFDLILSDLMMH